VPHSHPASATLPARRGGAVFADFAVSRAQMLAAVLVLSSVNGLASHVIASVTSQSWSTAIADTFDISVIVWGAWASACYLAFQQSDAQLARPTDFILAGLALIAVALPVPPLSWLTLCLFSVYVFWTSPARTPLRRSAVIFFAMCVPMFWGPMLFNFVAPPLLKIDALLVSTLVGTERIGNVVEAVDGIHRIQVWPACSSFHNISQAGLAWVALSQTLGRMLSLKDVLWCGCAVALAAGVNLVRLSLMLIYFVDFDTLHGPIGSQTAGAVTLLLIVVVCMFGLRRELFARA
jgi:hypothetical protein